MNRRGRLAKNKEPAERPDAWEAAVKLLAMRALSTQELRQRLLRRGYPPPEIDAVLARLRASRYLDDAEYARAWARTRAHRRSLGPARLANELRARGIADAEISNALDEAFAGTSAREVAEAAATRKLKGLRGLAQAVARRRLAAHLTRLGFAVEIVLALCRKHFPHGDESNDQ
ncbi:MAG: regulatory protein RecX [candidate division NC10 bacterium]|nr:regulatory protein RecX [candidate division NC10 bacterium]